MSRTTTISLGAAFALTIAVFPSGCRAFQDAMLSHILRNQAKLQSYRGVLVERGLVPEGDLKSDIAFARPDRVLVRALSPEIYKGSTILAADGNVTLYWPQFNYAIRVDHLPQPDAEGQRRLVTDAYRHDLATYDVDIGDSGHASGHPTVALTYTAKRPDTLQRKSTFSVYDKFSIPVAGEMHFAGGADYAFHYDSIDFNQPVDDATFQLNLPPATLITHWDLDGPNVPPADAKAQANFPLTLPDPPDGLLQTRVVRVDGPLPAYTVVYRSDPHYLLLTEYKDLGIRLAAAEIGVPLTVGKHQGKLLLAPLSSTYTFRENGVVYQVFGNVPFEDLLAFAGRL